jgi:Flp pilus assembly protein TadD
VAQQRAIESQQEAIRLTPENVNRWQALASIYETAGRKELAEEARQKVQSLSQKQGLKTVRGMCGRT